MRPGCLRARARGGQAAPKRMRRETVLAHTPAIEGAERVVPVPVPAADVVVARDDPAHGVAEHRNLVRLPALTSGDRRCGVAGLSEKIAIWRCDAWAPPGSGYGGGAAAPETLELRHGAILAQEGATVHAREGCAVRVGRREEGAQHARWCESLPRGAPPASLACSCWCRIVARDAPGHTAAPPWPVWLPPACAPRARAPRVADAHGLEAAALIQQAADRHAARLEALEVGAGLGAAGLGEEHHVEPGPGACRSLLVAMSYENQDPEECRKWVHT